MVEEVVTEQMAKKKQNFFFAICSVTTSSTIVGTPARPGCTPSSRWSCASRSVDLRSFICFLTIITPTAKLAAKPQKKPESPMNALVSFGCAITGTNCGAVSIAGVSTTAGIMADDGTAGAAGICNPGDCAGPQAARPISTQAAARSIRAREPSDQNAIGGKSLR